MTTFFSILKLFIAALPGIAGTVLYYEGLPVISKVPYIGYVPLVGDLAIGEKHRYANEQVRIASAKMVTAFEYGALVAQLNKERDLRLKGSQALEEYRKRADAALSVEQSDNDRMEQEIADYEAKLADANRCRITPDLRKWLQSK
jgi:hypothetical protein